MHGVIDNPISIGYTHVCAASSPSMCPPHSRETWCFNSLSWNVDEEEEEEEEEEEDDDDDDGVCDAQ